MSQNLMFLCGRKTAIALLDETLYAMIDHCHLSEINGKNSRVWMQDDTNLKYPTIPNRDRYRNHI